MMYKQIMQIWNVIGGIIYLMFWGLIGYETIKAVILGNYFESLVLVALLILNFDKKDK